jgi:hypothetical protein
MRSCRVTFYGPFGVFSNILKKFNLFFSVDPFTRKDWYDVKAPSMFATRQIGKTLVNRTQGTSKFLFWSFRLHSELPCWQGLRNLRKAFLASVIWVAFVSLLCVHLLRNTQLWTTELSATPWLIFIFNYGPSRTVNNPFGMWGRFLIWYTCVQTAQMFMLCLLPLQYTQISWIGYNKQRMH